MNAPAQPILSDCAEDLITIIAPTLIEVMTQFHSRRLAALGYFITGPVRRHHFALADESGAGDMFGGASMMAATFQRISS